MAPKKSCRTTRQFRGGLKRRRRGTHGGPGKVERVLSPVELDCECGSLLEARSRELLVVDRDEEVRGETLRKD